MEHLKKILRRLFLLPPWLTVLIAVPSFIFVFVMLGSGRNDTALGYLSYGLSAYSMVILVTGITSILQVVRQGIETLPVVQKIQSTALGSRYLGDTLFRAEVSLYTGLFINLVYVAVKLLSGIYYRSLWFVALSGYYVFLSLLRFLLLSHVRRNPVGKAYVLELRRYRLCGALLLVLNLALSVIVTLVVMWNQGFEYGGYLIYAMAMYTFYTAIKSGIQVVMFRKYNSPVMSASKLVSLTAALVSVLSLETAMLSQFGTASDPNFRRTVTATTGFGVCAFVLGAAIYMLVRASRELKRVRAS